MLFSRLMAPLLSSLLLSSLGKSELPRSPTRVSSTQTSEWILSSTGGRSYRSLCLAATTTILRACVEPTTVTRQMISPCPIAPPSPTLPSGQKPGASLSPTEPAGTPAKVNAQSVQQRTRRSINRRITVARSERRTVRSPPVMPRSCQGSC